MYLKHFGLKEKPYQYLIADPRYFYYAPQFLSIKRQADYITSEKEGHLYVCGDIGVGKTTLIKALASSLSSDPNNQICFINVPNLRTSNALARRISEGFEVKTWRSYSQTLVLFTEWLKKSKKFPILIIDEAQYLSRDCLKLLHYLMSYTTNKLLLMIILSGQLELRTKIDRFKALKSRMYPAFLSSLTLEETEKMMLHRWKVAGGKDLPFTGKAISSIYKYSLGNPRAICQLVNVSLLAGFNTKSKTINKKMIEIAIEALKGKDDR